MVLFRTLTVKKADTMKKLLLSLTAAVALTAGSAQATLTLTIEDVLGLSGAPPEVFTDAGTPGQITITTANSLILDSYYNTGSIQSVISNYTSTDTFANLISSSINLNAAGIFPDAIVINLDGEYTEPAGDQGLATTNINAATIDNASFDAVVSVSLDTLLAELDIADLNTRTATDTVDLIRGAGGTYPIRHAFILSSDAVGSDLGFDVSTRVDALQVPSPIPLALMGLGLVGLGITRKLSK
jgi:hypothetical protein